MEGGESSSVYAMPSPPPRSTTSGVQPSAERASAAKPARISIAACAGLEPVDRHPLGAEVEKLRADVHVKARDVEPGQSCPPNCLESIVGSQTELRPEVRRSDRLVGVRFDAGSHAHEHAADACVPRPVDFLERVEHEEFRICLGRGLKLLVALVVAVDDETRRRYSGA
jgi:hypothetical protein